MRLLKRIILWSLVLLVLLILDRVYLRVERQEREIKDLLGKGYFAIKAKQITIKDSQKGDIIFVRSSNYPDEFNKKFKEQERISSPEDLIKFLPDNFSEYWVLAGKEGMPLKGAIISGILQGLLGLKLENPIPPSEQENLNAYGLDDPGKVIKIEFDDARPLELQLGAKNLDYRIIYVRVGEDPNVYPIKETKLEFLTIDPDQIHVEQVYTSSLPAVKEMSLKIRDLEYVVDLSSLDKPRLTKPFKAKASYSTIQKIDNELQGLIAENWVGYGSNLKLSDYNLDNPLVTLTLKTADRVTSISFSYDNQNKPVGYSTNYMNAVFRPSVDPINRLKNFIGEIREKRHFRFSIFDVSRIVIDGSNIVQESATKWTKDGKNLQTDLVEKFLNKLKEVEAVVFLETKPKLSQTVNLKVLTNSGENYDCELGISEKSEPIFACEEIFKVSSQTYNEVLSSLNQLTSAN